MQKLSQTVLGHSAMTILEILCLRPSGMDLSWIASRLRVYSCTMAAQEDGTTSNLRSLPIACTLTSGALRERLGLIRALTAEALVGYDRDALVLTLRYAPEAVERVRALVASEQHCCAFLNFDVQAQPDVVVVTITAPENARDATDELFEQFIAAGRVNR